MRRSELAGAVRSLVDLDLQTLTKADTRIVVSGRAEESDGKTEVATTPSLDAFTIDYLHRHFAMLDEQSEAFGTEYDARGWLFCHPDGQPLHPETITRRFNRLVDAAGVPRISLHNARHTYATLALDNGIDLKIVSARLGHASETFTARVYQHALPGWTVRRQARWRPLFLRDEATGAVSKPVSNDDENGQPDDL